MNGDPGITAEQEDRGGFRFRGGSHVLDMTATVQKRKSPVPRELLETPEDLDRWLVAAGLAACPPGSGEEELKTARDLREAIFALAGSLSTKPFENASCDVLNRVAATPAATPQLSPNGVLTWTGDAGGLLSLLARDAVELFAGPQSGLVKQCHSEACTIFFIDTSRAGDRRWCSMAACGNRAKVAEFRRRKSLRD